MISSGIKNFWRAYRRNKAAVIALFILLFIVFLALFSGLIAPNSPIKTAIGPNLKPPTLKFPMGTDQLGRDAYSGVIHGSKIALLVGVIVGIISLILGLLVGLISGYWGGLVDDLLMRITEIVMVLPSFILALVILSLYGNSIWHVIIVLGILGWPSIARIVRGEVLSLREREFIEAERMIGSSSLSIIFIEILPNTLPPVIIAGTLEMSKAILLEAGLSFLGLGDPALLSWGRMLFIAQRVFHVGAWWLVLFPGIAIFLTVLAFNLIGDGLNDALSPKLK